MHELTPDMYIFSTLTVGSPCIISVSVHPCNMLFYHWRRLLLFGITIFRPVKESKNLIRLACIFEIP